VWVDSSEATRGINHRRAIQECEREPDLLHYFINSGNNNCNHNTHALSICWLWGRGLSRCPGGLPTLGTDPRRACVPLFPTPRTEHDFSSCSFSCDVTAQWPFSPSHWLVRPYCVNCWCLGVSHPWRVAGNADNPRFLRGFSR